jgi:outer membrane protein OmpA-like peptidoglycan-associated protein
MNPANEPFLYYSGLLEAMFETVKTKDTRPGIRVHELRLHPRFRLDNVQLLEDSFKGGRDRFELEDYLDSISWIWYKEEGSVEFEETKDRYFLKDVQGIWFLANPNHEIQVSDKDGLWKWTQWNELSAHYLVNSPHEDGLEQGSFKAQSTSDLHGRLKGNAILRVPNPAYVPTEEELKEVARRAKVPNFWDDGVLANRRGCMDAFFRPNQRIMNTAQPWLNAAGIPLGDVVDSTGSGCLGCQNRVWQMGCGCLSLLLALLLAFWLIWCVILGRCDSGNSEQTTNNQRDTVYIEVIREFKDTLKVVERDTVAFIDSTKEESFMMVALPNVQFYTDQAVLLPSSSKELVTVAEYMTNNPEATAEIYGHTDSVGNDQHNMQLSQRRAEAVKNFLSSLGVEPNRITATGFGETRPKASNGTPEGRLMNRRVEMKLTQPKKVTKSRTQVSPDSIKQSMP